jgi:hypothetical protein
VNVDFSDSPTLGRFLGSDHPARLVVGPFGSGKSTACIAEFVRRAVEQKPSNDGKRRTRFAAIRNTYPQLRDTTRKTFEQWIGPELGDWNEQQFTFTMKFADVECEILFRSLDRPADVAKLLSLELTGAYINEWREIPKEIFEGLTGRIGRYPSMAEGGPGWRGIWGDTNPWHPTHWLPLLLKKHPDAVRVFRQPSGLATDAENKAHLEPGYYDRLCVGKDDSWVDVYVRGMDAEAAVGSIYGRHLALLRARGGVSGFDHETTDCFTGWDFGIADSMAVWVWRFNKDRGVDVVDWYENSGHGLPHYFAWLKERPYSYVAHYLPHDGRARSWHTGRSAVELFEEEWGAGNVVIAPELSVDDGIGASRWLLEQTTTKFHARTDEVPKDRDLSGLGTLAEYKFAYDETNKVFSKIPLHNFASHSADAFRTMACAVRHGEIISRPREQPKEPEPLRVVIGEDGSVRVNRTFKQLAARAIGRGPGRKHV